jgi:hypothetical protein
MGILLQFPFSAVAPRAFGKLTQTAIRDADGVRLIDAILAEVISTALLTTVTTGLINLHSGSGSKLCSKQLITCLPPKPVVFPGARRAILDYGIPWNIINRCVEYYDYLDSAKQALSHLLLHKHSHSHDDCMACGKVIDLWQAACATALLAIYELDNISAEHPNIESLEHMTAISDALIAARDGGAPFLHKGLPNFPEWAERRHKMRFTVNASALLTTPRRKSNVMVINASRKGFGLDLVVGVNVRDLVSIELENGRKFIGTVKWFEGKRAGVMLRKSLSASDPLLGG